MVSPAVTTNTPTNQNQPTPPRYTKSWLTPKGGEHTNHDQKRNQTTSQAAPQKQTFRPIQRHLRTNRPQPLDRRPRTRTRQSTQPLHVKNNNTKRGTLTRGSPFYVPKLPQTRPTIQTKLRPRIRLPLLQRMSTRKHLTPPSIRHLTQPLRNRQAISLRTLLPLIPLRLRNTNKHLLITHLLHRLRRRLSQNRLNRTSNLSLSNLSSQQSTLHIIRRHHKSSLSSIISASTTSKSSKTTLSSSKPPRSSTLDKISPTTPSSKTPDEAINSNNCNDSAFAASPDSTTSPPPAPAKLLRTSMVSPPPPSICNSTTARSTFIPKSFARRSIIPNTVRTAF